MKTYNEFLTEEEDPKGCPLPTQDFLKHYENKLEAMTNPKKAYGPEDPTLPNVAFWEAKAATWKVLPEVARGRLCSNCEYFDESEKTSACVANGKAIEGIKILQVELHCGDHAGRLAYCTKHKFIAEELRVCNGWESAEKEKK